MVNISPEGVTAPDGLHQHVGDLRYSLDISFFFFFEFLFICDLFTVCYGSFTSDLPISEMTKMQIWRLSVKAHKIPRHLSSSRFCPLMLCDCIYYCGFKCMLTCTSQRHFSQPSCKFSACQGFAERYPMFFSCIAFSNFGSYCLQEKMSAEEAYDK